MFRWLKKGRVAHLAIVLLFVVPMVGLLSIVPNDKQPYASKVRLWFDSLEFSTIDYRIQFGRKAKADPQIVLLALDAPSVSLEALDDPTIAASKPLSLIKKNGYPFPRDVYAAASERLLEAGAKTVTFDIFFLSVTPSDAAFQQVLDKYRDQIVIGLNFSDEKSSLYYKLPAVSLIPSQDTFDGRLGYLNFWADSTEKEIRSVRYRTNIDYLSGHVGAEKLPMLYSLSARTAQRAGYLNLPNDPLDRSFRFAAPSSFANFPFYTIFDPHSWDKTFQNGDYFRGKIVVIGPVGDWAKDSFITPVGEIPGVELHINAINCLLHNDFLTPATSALIQSSVIGAGLISLFLSMTLIQISWRFIASLGIVGAYAAAAFWAINGPGWLLPIVGPMSVFCGATGVGFVYDFVLTQIEKLRLRTTFERYNSKNVVKYLLDHVENYEAMLAGTRQPVTALFSDIRGFTTMAEEAADSQKLVAKLNEYLTAMVDIVFKFDGTLDCFMGDGIMAVWGNTPFNFGPKGDAVRAVQAALAMIVELRKLNAKWIAEGGAEWKIGIGLNHGDVIVGDIGSKEHSEFAAIGDAVNLASRIEGLTKEYHVELLIGESVADLVRDSFHLKSVDLVQVKGKKKPVEVFAVLGEKSTALPAEMQKFLELYEEGLVRFRQRDFVGAKDLFFQARQLQPGDFLAGDYMKGCDQLIATPPDATWTGVHVMTKK